MSITIALIIIFFFLGHVYLHIFPCDSTKLIRSNMVLYRLLQLFHSKKEVANVLFWPPTPPGIVSLEQLIW